MPVARLYSVEIESVGDIRNDDALEQGYHLQGSAGRGINLSFSSNRLALQRPDRSNFRRTMAVNRKSADTIRQEGERRDSNLLGIPSLDQIQSVLGTLPQ